MGGGEELSGGGVLVGPDAVVFVEAAGDVVGEFGAVGDVVATMPQNPGSGVNVTSPEAPFTENVPPGAGRTSTVAASKFPPEGAMSSLSTSTCTAVPSAPSTQCPRPHKAP